VFGCVCVWCGVGKISVGYFVYVDVLGTIVLEKKEDIEKREEGEKKN